MDGAFLHRYSLGSLGFTLIPFYTPHSPGRSPSGIEVRRLTDSDVRFGECLRIYIYVHIHIYRMNYIVIDCDVFHVLHLSPLTGTFPLRYLGTPPGRFGCSVWRIYIYIYIYISYMYIHVYRMNDILIDCDV